MEEMSEIEEEEPIIPRNFILAQLRKFDGTIDPKTDEPRPLYLSISGTVFDVKNGKDFYGPGGPYEKFAGRECGVALAKMSFEEEDLDDIEGCQKLSRGDQDQLAGWVHKFTYYRNYAVVGKVIPYGQLPSKDRIVSKEELMNNDGSGEIPDGYATAPIFIGAGGKVFDGSFGGVEHYGKDCSYNKFAGKDASRALAKMSFDPADTENPDISDLSEQQKKTLDGWVNTFENQKMYPIVGKLA